MRGQDLNLRPSGYEPDELPGCSTPRWWFCVCVCLRVLEDLAATYSPASWDAVPWALGVFTAEFGMGSGAGPPPEPPGRPRHAARVNRALWQVLVSVGVEMDVWMTAVQDGMLLSSIGRLGPVS